MIAAVHRTSARSTRTGLQSRGIIISKYAVQNIVASANLGAELDLSRLALTMDGAEYEPKAFPGLIFRLKDPKTATLLFRSGKIVCTGSKTLDQVSETVQTVASIVKRSGAPIDDLPSYNVQNIVASADLGQGINLASIVMALGLEKVEYEPEVFPGLVYRLYEPKAVLLIFGSGKMVCTGAKTFQEVEAAVDKVAEDLRSVDLL